MSQIDLQQMFKFFTFLFTDPGLKLIWHTVYQNKVGILCNNWHLSFVCNFVCNQVECPLGVHSCICRWVKTINICTGNVVMNEDDGQMNGKRLFAQMNPSSASNTTLVGSESCYTVLRNCRTLVSYIVTVILHQLFSFEYHVSTTLVRIFCTLTC